MAKKIIQSVPYPTYTTAQRDALTGVLVDYKIYNSDTGVIERWDGMGWIGEGGGGNSVASLKWRYNNTAFTGEVGSRPTEGEFGFNSDKSKMYIHFTQSDGETGSSVSQYLLALKMGSVIVFKDTDGNVNDFYTASDGTQIATGVSVAVIDISELLTINVSNGSDCVFDVLGGGAIDTYSVYSPPALVNIQSNAYASLAQILSNIDELIGAYDTIIELSDETSNLTINNDKEFEVIRFFWCQSITLAVNIAPEGQSIKCEIENNGVSMIGLNPIELTAGSKTVTVDLSAQYCEVGDRITCNITQVGSSTTGAGAKLYFKGHLLIGGIA